MRVGLVGAGPWGAATHAVALRAHPGTTLAGVWARRPEQAAALGAPVFADPDALFAAVDAVAFAVPPAVQAELAPRAAAAGCHLVLEKPLADTLAGAQRVADAVAAAGVRSVLVLTRRFAPETRAFLADAAAGRWSGGAACWLSGALLGGPFAASPWRREGGALADVGPHVLDLLDAALGAVTGVALARREEPTDTWTLALTHAGGATSSATLSLRTPVTPSVLRVAVHGPGGHAVLTSRATPATDCYAVLLDELAEVVRTGADHPLDVRRGAHLQAVAEQVHAALP